MIQIIGAGAIGCLWLAKLLQSDQHCHIVSRSTTCDQPLLMTDCSGELHQFTPSHSHQLLHSNFIEQHSIILVCVKAQHVLSALLMQAPFISRNQPIILMHNGYGCAEIVIEHFPNNPIICATTANASLLHSPFNITHTGKGATYFGAFNAHAKALCHLLLPFQEAMPEVYWNEDIIEKCWLKLAINAVINPLTAVYQINNGQLKQPQYSTLIHSLIEEVFTIAQAENIQLELTLLHQIITHVIDATAENFSSMNRDIFYQRETEIDFINGYLIKKAQQHHIVTPLLIDFQQQIKTLEHRSLAVVNIPPY